MLMECARSLLITCGLLLAEAVYTPCPATLFGALAIVLVSLLLPRLLLSFCPAHNLLCCCIVLRCCIFRCVLGPGLDAIEEALLRALKRHKSSEVSISSFGLADWNKMSASSGLQLKLCPSSQLCVSADRCVEAGTFRWTDAKEPDQADRYGSDPFRQVARFMVSTVARWCPCVPYTACCALCSHDCTNVTHIVFWDLQLYSANVYIVSILVNAAAVLLLPLFVAACAGTCPT